MYLANKLVKKTKGLMFYKLLGTGAGAGFSLFPDFQTYSILCVWKDDKSANEAKKLDALLQPLHHSLFIESNPSPVKYAAKLLNLCEDDVRLPLVKITDSTKEIVKKALLSAKLI